MATNKDVGIRVQLQHSYGEMKDLPEDQLLWMVYYIACHLFSMFLNSMKVEASPHTTTCPQPHHEVIVHHHYIMWTARSMHIIYLGKRWHQEGKKASQWR